jgi:hypothetical protein
MSRSRRWWGLILALVAPGCSAENTVAGRDKTRAEALESALPTWCPAICERLRACDEARDACNCDGDVCSCPNVDENCPSECQRSMERFTTNEACAALGQRYVDCVDQQTCSGLVGARACDLTMTERASCPALDDTSTPPDAADGGSAVGAGGTGSAGASVTCVSAYGTGGTASATPPPSPAVLCDEGRGECSDGHQYSWLCASGSEGQLGCSCFIDTQVTGVFDPGSDSCPSLEAVNAGCHWNVAP